MKAQRDGAIGSITLKVVDQDGNAVSNANVRGGFYNHGKSGYGFDKTIGPDGLVELKNRCVGDLHFSIEKAGYYKTSFTYWFFKAWHDCAKDGRWLPWNPIIEVVLKQKVNPVAMCVRPNREGLNPLVPPSRNEYIGFDLEKGDWVKPHGKGILADLNLKYEYEVGKIPSIHYRGAVFFVFTNKYDGVYVMKKDSFSSFKSVYQAETNAVYRQKIEFVYDRLSGEVKENSKFPVSDYLVLRTRSKTDEYGNLVSANYAKIYGPVAAGGGGVYMGFYFNPNENDPNLEADMTKNLLNPRDLDFAP